jgi:glycosyltransferase involved in cell wall biosynthesis
MAQVFLNPGLVGLTILEAFAAGLPVVTADFRNHSPEIEYLVPGVNGVITAADRESYASAVVNLLDDDALRASLREGALATARSHSIEAMVENFHRGILDWMAAAHVPQPRAPRVAFVTNIIATYRLPDFLALSRLFPTLVILLSRKTIGENLAGSGVEAAELSGLDVRYMRSVSFLQRQRHSTGFVQDATVLVPYDMIHQLRRLRPDVIVSSELGLRSLQACLYRFFNRGVRLIVHADLSERTELGRGIVRRWLRRFILAHVDAVLVNGESGRRYVAGYGVSGDRIFAAPYSTQPGPYLNVAREPVGDRSIRLLYVGQFIPRKGLVEFLYHLARWCSTHDEVPVRWILVGKGDREAELRAVHLPPNLEIEIRLPVNYANLPSVYAEGDIFVLPTLADTWALVINEAMLSGLPVLGSVHSQAVAELVADGVTGWIFDPESETDLVACLDRCLAADHAKLTSMGQAARERAKQLTPELVANAFGRAIASVASPSMMIGQYVVSGNGVEHD